MTEEAAIRFVLEERARAIRAKNVVAALAAFADDVVNFDLAPPLVQRGSEATNPEIASEWFASWDGGIGLELRDFTIHAESSVAFCYGFVRLFGKRIDGTHTSVWARSTVCLEKRLGQWKIVHEHTSFPMMMDGSEKAATNLEP